MLELGPTILLILAIVTAFVIVSVFAFLVVLLNHWWKAHKASKKAEADRIRWDREGAEDYLETIEKE